MSIEPAYAQRRIAFEGLLDRNVCLRGVIRRVMRIHVVNRDAGSDGSGR